MEVFATRFAGSKVVDPAFPWTPTHLEKGGGGVRGHKTNFETHKNNTCSFAPPPHSPD